MPRVIRSKATVIAALAATLLLVAAPVGDAKPGKAKGPKGPRPDLVLALSSKAPASAILASELNLALKVRNKGRAQAGKSQVGVYLAKGQKRGKKDVRLGRAKVKALKVRKNAKVKLAVTIPANVTAGTYRLIACADDTRHVREAKEGNDCAASSAFAVAANSPVRPAAAAFSMTDGFDWGFVENADEIFPTPGAPVSVSLKAANGIPGQAGYTSSKVAGMPLITGTVTTLDYSNRGPDDSAVTVKLPFAFPFGGVAEHSVSVSTNGWIGFGSAAPDFWNHNQEKDYRGEQYVLGNFERGIMPYWGDLDLSNQGGAGSGKVQEVVAGDGSVAFQWDIGQHTVGTPRRTFEVVLFPDGRFRMDYPGENTPGGNIAFVGYSFGTGPSSVNVVATKTEAVPSTSLLFTPNPVAAGTALDPGQATLTLPPESRLVSADPGCALAKAPGASTPGLVSCATPAIAPGSQLERTVTFAMPPNALAQPDPANFGYQGTYTSGNLALSDRDEIDELNSTLLATTITPTASYVPPPPPATTPKVGEPSQFSATIKAESGGLDEPSVTFTLPANTNLDSIQIAGANLPCGAPSAGKMICPLPSGMRETKPPITVTVTPTAAAANTELTLGVSAQALNAPVATGTAKSPPVAP